jgi:hypothetical protein
MLKNVYKMVNYDNSIIYKICCKDLTIKEIYVGGTTNFTRRKYEHRTNCRCPKSKKHNRPVYKFIRDNGTMKNWDIIILERFKAIDKEDLRQKEREWIEKLEPTLNCQKLPYRTDEDIKKWRKEYSIKISDKNKVKCKNWYYENKERVDKYKKEKIECDCGSIVSRTNLTRHKKSKKHLKFLQP